MKYVRYDTNDLGEKMNFPEISSCLNSWERALKTLTLAWGVDYIPSRDSIGPLPASRLLVFEDDVKLDVSDLGTKFDLRTHPFYFVEEYTT